MLAIFPLVCIHSVCSTLSYVCACLQESSLLVQQASLKGELEGVHQQLETSKVKESFFVFFVFLSFFLSYKLVVQKLHTSVSLCVEIEMCEMTADCHRLQEQLRSALDQQQRTSNSLQQCITGLQQERDSVKVSCE